MISVFLTSIRPWKWQDFYNSIKEATRKPFEIVITVPHNIQVPAKDIPQEFRIVRTGVKPAQAMEAAFRHCRYPYVVQAVDDIKFDPLALDNLLKIVQNQERTIATCKYGVGWRDSTCSQTEGIFGLCEWAERATNIPLQPVCPMLRAMDWTFAGGIDPRFGAQYGELDLFLRLIAGGWKVVMTNDWVRENEGGSDLWRTKGQNDLREIRKLWRDSTPAGNWTTTLRKGSSSYVGLTILTENQGKVW